jgi:transcription-repair coupling factor (superfamily II helicase)
MLELKLVAKAAGFSRIKPEGKQHVVMETPMEEPGLEEAQRESCPAT